MFFPDTVGKQLVAAEKEKRLFRLKCYIAGTLFGLLFGLFIGGFVPDWKNRCPACREFDRKNQHIFTFGPNTSVGYRCQMDGLLPPLPPTDDR